MNNREFAEKFARTYIAKSNQPSEYEAIELNPFDYDADYPGIQFHQVGYNSDTSFYLGVDEHDNLYRRSSSIDWELTIPEEEYYALMASENEDDWHKAYDCRKMIPYVNVRKITQDTIGYIGHW